MWVSKRKWEDSNATKKLFKLQIRSKRSSKEFSWIVFQWVNVFEEYMNEYKGLQTLRGTKCRLIQHVTFRSTGIRGRIPRHSWSVFVTRVKDASMSDTLHLQPRRGEATKMKESWFCFVDGHTACERCIDMVCCLLRCCLLMNLTVYLLRRWDRIWHRYEMGNASESTEISWISVPWRLVRVLNG